MLSFIKKITLGDVTASLWREWFRDSLSEQVIDPWSTSNVCCVVRKIQSSNIPQSQREPFW